MKKFDFSKLTTEQKSVVDEIINGLKSVDENYNDPSKIKLKKNSNEDWDCYYDDEEVDAYVVGDFITEEQVATFGWNVEGGGENEGALDLEINDPNAEITEEPGDKKPKKRPIGVGTNGPENNNGGN